MADRTIKTICPSIFDLGGANRSQQKEVYSKICHALWNYFDDAIFEGRIPEFDIRGKSSLTYLLKTLTLLITFITESKYFNRKYNLKQSKYIYIGKYINRKVYRVTYCFVSDGFGLDFSRVSQNSGKILYDRNVSVRT